MKEVFTASVAGGELSFETGRMAKQANGSVVAQFGETMVLATVCAAKQKREGQSFFPLSVDYQEKTYAAGKIPGGFFKREGRLAEHEILACRLTDRPLRPLFEEGYLHDTQIIITVLSVDKDHEPDVLGMTAASAALMISDIPFKEPIAGIRVGRVDGKVVFNPNSEELAASDMNILVAGTESSVIMVEGHCEEVPEAEMAELLFQAHKEIQPLIAIQKEMRSKIGKPTMEWTADKPLEEVVSYVREIATAPMGEALSIKVKLDRYTKKDELKADVKAKALEKFASKIETDEEFTSQAVESAVSEALESIASEVMRKKILEEKIRIDGRDLTTVRPIEIETRVLPRVHGSTLFTRGETQALVTCTLGAADDSQKIDKLVGGYEKTFILHYNFPPFSVGETKPLRGPSRRDIGHGALAEGSLANMVPNQKEFPYTVRIVSEILESNGSSSMASVCGGSLAMMDAGVPGIKPTAGIAMGLIAEGERMEILTDILGDEDHLGDMDFKVTGTKDGITGFQLDTKISGITLEVMTRALNQAKDARIHILDKMNEALPSSREEVSKYAPKRVQIKVRQSKIKDVIGPGGKNIKSVIEATGAKIDINDDGTINIFSTDPEMGSKAVQLIEALSGEVEVGRVYHGQVRKIMDFGAFVNIAPGTDGLCHISELSEDRVKRVEDVVNEGDMVDVKVLDIDRQGRIRLSLKEASKEKAASGN